MATVDQGGNSVSADMSVGTTTPFNMILMRNSNPSAVVTSASLGMPVNKGIVNQSSTANASIFPSATGTVISRSVADGNIPLIVNSAAGTGAIQNWNQAGIPVAFMNLNGVLYGSGLSNGQTLTMHSLNRN